MKSMFSLLAFLVGATMAIHADYINDRRAAERLIDTGKLGEAFDVFVKLANDPATSASQKEDALEQACLLAIQTRRLDQAKRLAETISNPVASKVCRMKILTAQGEWKGLVDQFKDEDLSVWPEAYIDIGYYQRGLAHSRLGDFQTAERDLKKAIEAANDDRHSQAIAAKELADAYVGANNDENALKTFALARTFAKSSVLHLYYNAILERARLFMKLGKNEDASRELATITLAQLHDHPAWRFRFLRAWGDLRAAEGKPEEAQRYYDEALTITDALPSEIVNLKKQLKK